MRSVSDGGAVHVDLYHITLTVPSREPLLGTLVIPENNPSLARIERMALGNAVVDELYVIVTSWALQL